MGKKYYGMKMVLFNYVDEAYPLKFSVANLRKDLTLAVKEMEKSKKKLPILQQTQAVYSQAVEKGLGEEDFSAIIKTIGD